MTTTTDKLSMRRINRGGRVEEEVSHIKMDYSLFWSAISLFRSHRSTRSSGNNIRRRINVASLGEDYQHCFHWIIYTLREAEKKCVINNWVYVETQKNVMYFPYCDVIFFLDCYSLFNNTSNLVHMKNILQKNKNIKPHKNITNCYVLRFHGSS